MAKPKSPLPEVVYLTIGDLTPAPYNPRVIKDERFAQLKRNITKDPEFFLQRPCLVNQRDGKLIVYAGNQRLRAATDLGWQQVPCILSEIPLELERERNIKDNRNEGEWDRDTLALNFKLDELRNWGFGDQELTNLYDDRKVEEDEGPVAPPERAKTEPGQLFMLAGRDGLERRLLCGDATKDDSYRALFGDLRARMIFTDPPYSVNYVSTAGNSYQKGKYSKDPEAENAIWNDDKDPAAAQEFYTEVLHHLYEYSTKDASLYWWLANKMNWVNRLAWIAAGWSMAQMLIWLKESMIFSLGQDYHRCYEPCMFGWKKGESHFTNHRIANVKDCFTLDDVAFKELPDVWVQRRDKTNEYVHPTQKPVRLAERALKKNSLPGDLIADVFGGSGSTLLACDQLGRRCFTMELDPKFCDAILTRWCRYAKQNETEIREASMQASLT